MLQDIAILTGGQVITEELGLDIKEATLSQLGRAEKIIVQKENTIIVGGKGDENRSVTGLHQLKLRLKKQPPNLTKRNYRKDLQNFLAA